MPEFQMNGLRADNPQGWMAAIGVQYILARLGEDPLLHWEGVVPILTGSDEEQVMESLKCYLSKGSDILERLPRGRGKEKSALDRTAGKVSFVGVIEQMQNMVTSDHLHSALTQVWRNTENICSLGWDPKAVKRAYSLGGSKAPDQAPHQVVLGGQWLAAESLPITGTGPRLGQYEWVTWGYPLDLDGVWAVVQARSTDWGGVRFQSKVGRNGQMGYLEPARRGCKPN